MVTRRPATVTEAAELSDALDAPVAAEGAGLPVLDGDGAGLVGWVTHQSLLDAPRHDPAAAVGRRSTGPWRRPPLVRPGRAYGPERRQAGG